MGKSRYETVADHRRVVEVSLSDDEIRLEVSFGMISSTAAWLTPAQARRIAAHLLKLAEMREKESKG